MLESLLRRPSNEQPKSITVLWGGRNLQDLYINFNKISGEFLYIPVQSRPANDWIGAKGYVQDVLLDTRPDLTNAVIYACGSDIMIHAAKISLIKAGLSLKNFYSDAFVRSGIN
jgi:CDP-4-dehydro-6-deoxyglucose reductase